jgi:hypothetical protein
LNNLTEQDYAFFATLAEAVAPFKSHDIPHGNCEGCIVFPKEGKKKERLIVFGFAIAPGRILDVEIDIDSLRANPKEYIEQMLDGINEAIKQAKQEFDSVTFVPRGESMLNVIQQVNATRH